MVVFVKLRKVKTLDSDDLFGLHPRMLIIGEKRGERARTELCDSVIQGSGIVRGVII